MTTAKSSTMASAPRSSPPCGRGNALAAAARDSWRANQERFDRPSGTRNGGQATARDRDRDRRAAHAERGGDLRLACPVDQDPAGDLGLARRQVVEKRGQNDDEVREERIPPRVAGREPEPASTIPGASDGERGAALCRRDIVAGTDPPADRGAGPIEPGADDPIQDVVERPGPRQRRDPRGPRRRDRLHEGREAECIHDVRLRERWLAVNG